MNYRAQGFTQRKPRVPGVYFVSVSPRHGVPEPLHVRQGWDVAEVIFFAGSYSNIHEQREDSAHWRVQMLGGISCAWRPGMWLKGPISPATALPELPK